MTPKFDASLLPAYPDIRFENALWREGVESVAGIDEAGRGALAGPVSAAAVVLPANPILSNVLKGVRDSKQMTPKQREKWAQVIRESAITWQVGFASNNEIDDFGIVPATKLAAKRAIEKLDIFPEHLLIDALLLPEITPPQTSLIKGDARSLSIAAASILAKVTRDEYLRTQDELYPRYGFYANKGYGTAMHRAALDNWGPCPIHRRSFAPLKHQNSFSQ
ncbi:MAG: ribonuclease HII [Chloroflexi bacterium]|nr:ribonuclease HII [Chloroflexota bacterium]